MPRKPLWKDIFIEDRNIFHQLRGYYASNRGAWGKYQFEFHQGLGHIETNLPYSELRKWFSYSVGQSVPEHVTSEKPSWELYQDELD